MLLYKKGELTTLQALIGLLLAIPVLYLLFKVGGIVLTLISTGDDNSFIDFTERISKMNVNTVEDVKLEVNNGNIILAFDSNADSFKSSFGNYNRPTSCLFEMKEKRQPNLLLEVLVGFAFLGIVSKILNSHIHKERL